MSEKTIKKVLMNSGLTEKEAEVYIFLAKQDVLKGTEIARLMRKDKAQIFHLLKKLQTKGFIEATLEFPMRYSIVPFENILNSIIKAKKDEVIFIEQAKKELFDYLKKNRKTGLSPSLEKFLVIKGTKRVDSKIKKMIRDSQSHLFVIETIPDLIRGIQSGVFDGVFVTSLESPIEYRFITELSQQNLKFVEEFLNRTAINKFNLKARNPKLGLRLFPRMVIRDDEEILFFTTIKTDMIGKDDACLWTNCKSLIQAFTAVFQDLWNNSIDLQAKIAEIKIGKPIEKVQLINDPKIAYKKFDDTIRSAENEIILITSSKGLKAYWKNKSLLKNWNKKGVVVKIMAPIIRENQKIAVQLSKFCKVKHIPLNYPEITIVDGKYLFQLTKPPIDTDFVPTKKFENSFYSEDPEYLKKMEKTLNFIWEKARLPSLITLESALMINSETNVTSSSKGSVSHNHYRKMSGFRFKDRKQLKITEKDVLDKILKSKNHPVVDPTKESFVGYASVGGAIIYPPDKFNLPELVIQVFHIEKQSTFGEEDNLLISLRLETHKDYTYIPTAFVGNNPRAQVGWKALLEGTPAAQNVQLIKKEEIQVRIHGNSLFAGWTLPIPLLSQHHCLPPSCLLIEGYGDVKTHAYSTFFPSGYKNEVERNGFDAFVTYFHPSSQYSGPGTDGFFARDAIVTIIPPSNL